MDRECDMHRGEEKFIQGFGWKREGKRSLLRYRHRLEYNTKRILSNVILGGCGLDSCGLEQG